MAAAPGASAQTRQLSVVFAGQLVGAIAAGALAVMLPIYVVHVLGLGVQESALMIAMEYVPAAALGAYLGHLVQRFGAKTALVMADTTRIVACAVLLGVAYAGALQYWHLLVVAVLLGVTSVLFSVSSDVLLRDNTSAENRAKTNAQRTTALNCGLVAGPALGGVMALKLSVPAASAVCLTLFVVALLSVVVASVHSPKNASTPRQDRKESVTVRAWRVVVTIRELRIVFYASLALNIAGAALGGVFYVYVLNDLGMTAQAVGLSASCLGAGAILGGALAYRFSQKFTSLRVVFGAATCCVVAYVLIPSASFIGVWAIFGYQTFFGFGMTIWSINSGLLRQSKAPREVLSQVSAIFSMAATIAVPVGLVAAAGTSYVLHIGSQLWLFCACAVLAPVVFVLDAIMPRHHVKATPA